MTEILNKLILLLVAKGFILGEKLMPGLSENDITNTFKNSIGVVDSKLIELYSWRNGIDFGDSGRTRLFDIVFLSSLEDSIEDWKHMKDAVESGDNTFLGFFPICYSGSGEYYFYKYQGADKGKVFYYSPGDFGNESVKAFESLEDMFSSILTCYSQGIYKIGENGKYLPDFERELKLMKSLNPGCKRWQE
jgi:hypothetical protein